MRCLLSHTPCLRLPLLQQLLRLLLGSLQLPANACSRLHAGVHRGMHVHGNVQLLTYADAQRVWNRTPKGDGASNLPESAGRGIIAWFAGLSL